MRICVVTETCWPEVNGVAMTLHRWICGLVERGHEILLIAPRHPARADGTLIDGVTYHGTASVPMPGYREVRIGLPAPRLIPKLWREFTPDVVYVATEGPLSSSAVTVAKRWNIRVVSGFHTNFHSYLKFYSMGFLAPWVERKLVSFHNRTVCTIVPTLYQRDTLLDMGIDNVEVVGRGVDTNLFTPRHRSQELRRSWGVADDDLVMINVGRVAEEKNLDLMIEAWREARKVHPTLRFILVGEGPALPRIRQQYPDVILAGMRTGEELGAHYASADIFAFASRTETFGNVVLEAMASGLALVAFDYAAARQHVDRDRTGVLADFNHDAQFVDGVVGLVKDREHLTAIRNRAASYARRQGWDSIVKQLEHVLTGLVTDAREAA